MLKSFLRYGVEEPEEYELNRPYYLLKGDGVYMYKSTGALLIKKLFTGFADVKVPGLQGGSEGVEYNLPKIPFKYWLMILDFYKEVYERFSTEASAHIFYKKDGVELPEKYVEDENYADGLVVDGNWIIYCPQQINTGTLTKFGEDEFYNWLRTAMIPVIETHSHHKMNAFWSGTDVENQQDAQYYGVFGRIGSEDKFLMKHVVEGEMTDIPVTEVFEFPTVEIKKKLTQIDGYDVCVDNEDKVKNKPYEGKFNRKNEYPEKWFNMIQNQNTFELDKVKLYEVGDDLSEFEKKQNEKFRKILDK